MSEREHPSLPEVPLEPGLSTLLVPTHERHEQLERLLLYFERSKLEVPVIVLDSSSDDTYSANAELIKSVTLNVRQMRYPSDMDPYTKTLKGLDAFDTPFCSICADDDILFLPALRECVRRLQLDSAAAVAHGNYINFNEQAKQFQISYVVQRNESIRGENAMNRLERMMARYDAVFYAVHRTEVLRKSLIAATQMDTTLGKELVSGFIASLHGNIERLNTTYLCRCTDTSLPYSAWHPHQILCDDPDILFQDYTRLRCILDKEINAIEGKPEGSNKPAIDLFGLRYLAPFLRDDILQFIIDQRVHKGASVKQAVDKLWANFVYTKRPATPEIDLYIYDGQTFAPGVPIPINQRIDYRYDAVVHNGQRRYLFHHEFFYPQDGGPCIVDRDTVEDMIARLADY